MKTVIEMAREAGFSVKNFKPPVITAQHSNGSWVGIGENLERFAELVRADERDRAMRENAYVAVEREACITELERNADKTLDEIIAAIRARNDE